MIAEERARQLSQEGWTPEHDDTHINGELRDAGIAYATACDDRAGEDAGRLWPFETAGWKPKEDPVLNLVRAGAFFAAEIDRLQRLRGPGETERALMDSGSKLSSLFDGFVFSERRDIDHALALLDGLHEQAVKEDAARGGSFFLCGPPKAGKSVLLRRMEDFLSINSFCCSTRDLGDMRVYREAAKWGAPLVVLPLHCGDRQVPGMLKSELLHKWLGAEEWELRTFGTEEVKRIKLRCVTVLVGWVEPPAEDLPEGMKVIRLLERPREEKEEEKGAA